MAFDSKPYTDAGIEVVWWAGTGRRKIPTLEQCLTPTRGVKADTLNEPPEHIQAKMKKDFVLIGKEVCRASTGQPAGIQDPSKRCEIRVHSKWYMAHHISFLLHHGRWPRSQLDHLNMDKRDNRPENLEEVDLQTNVERNRKAKEHLKALPRGVSKMRDGYMGYACKHNTLFYTPRRPEVHQVVDDVRAIRRMLGI